MKRLISFLVLCMAAAPSLAAERVDTILEDHRLHGYRSPLAALERLQAAVDRPGAGTPLDARRRHDAALAEYASLARRPDVAKPALERLEAMAAREDCRPCRAQKLLIEGQSALVSDPDAAARAIERAATLIAAGDRPLQLQLRHLRARLYDTRGQLGKAMGDAVPALALAEELGNVADTIDVMALMVGLNADLGDHRRSERIARDAYALAERHGYVYMMGFIRLHQGYLYALAGQPGEQLRALRDALRIAGNDPGLAMVGVVSLANLADYHLQKNEPRQALAYAERAERVARSLGDDNARAVALANMGIAMARLGDAQHGIRRLTQAIALAETLDAKNYQVAMHEELVAVYESAGRPVDAVASMRKVVALTRELTQQEREKAVLELQEKYASERRSREIERLTAANRVKEAEVAARAWQQRLWAAIAVALALALVPLVQVVKRVRRANRQLSGDIAVLAEQSVHDPLTGAYNRRHCQQLMGQHEAQLRKADGRDYQAGVGLMVLDVDFFKKINDGHGHAVGDRVLVEIATRLRALVRQQDAVVRWGGEEFVLVLPGTPAQGLEVLAGRVLEAIGGTPVETGTERIPVTVSIGCAAFPLAAELGWEDALHVADLALYRSKSGGRNRATCIGPVAPGADNARLRSDLAAAQAAGDVELRTIVGPVPALRAISLDVA